MDFLFEYQATLREDNGLHATLASFYANANTRIYQCSTI